MRKVSMKRKSRKDKSFSKVSEEENSFEDNGNESDRSNNENENGSDEPAKRRKSNKRVSFSPKKAAKEVAESSENSEEEEEEEAQYEVEAILEEKYMKGIRHLLIRWKGYGEESDTWEPETTVNCPELLKEFNSKKGNISNGTPKKGKTKKIKKTIRPSKLNAVEDWDENEEFEVDRIIEVHHKRDGKREFLVSWKGYPPSQNSWEPEENMGCPDLITKFMLKVEKAKLSEGHDLRVNRAPTQRFNSVYEKGRRSRRYKGRQRVSYYDAD